MNKIHHVEGLRFTYDSLIVNVDGQEYTFLLAEISQKLSQASDTERNTYRIMASGYGIHWPLLDEDLSIDGLLGVVHTPPTSVTQGRQSPQTVSG
jgi:hypothetical protein